MEYENARGDLFHWIQTMEHRVETMEDIREASVVLYGNHAIVGFRPVQTLGDTHLKNKVHATVKNVRPGYRVHVTDNTEIQHRIQTVQEQIRNGQPVQTLAPDIGRLIRQIDHDRFIS